ncbi:uncharacterized protein LOC121989023 isoform X3 [Zingiber officinale]|uniref:uncharacterized protein LOC121989023 isoform X3 n=1 Tax=Zingiber officinale TaxID=94328 RepID=UPI001C4B1397|nr:uncharacterized protein LOC121989023 isoform X3 [Zingiber officinale]
MEAKENGEKISCEYKLRENPLRRKEKVFVGCGAGFGGDRPQAALKLLRTVKELDYLVLECLAERTLAERYQLMMSGGKGYDTRIKFVRNIASLCSTSKIKLSDWMSMLLPLAVERGTCIITNMGAVDPLGAQQVVLDLTTKLGFDITIAAVYEIFKETSGFKFSYEGCKILEGFLHVKGVSTYMGAAPIVECLERYKPHVVITSRVADAALFLAPMVYELGWNWNDFSELAQGALAGHLLECGCQLTGGYFMHPAGDKNREFSIEQILNLSLPYAEIGYKGEVCLAKAEGSGGLLNSSTCAEQLLYEVRDPSSYITPDVVIDLRNVCFSSLSNDKVLCCGAKPSSIPFPDKLLQLVPNDCGWKGWGEISYGGFGCIRRAEVAEFLVRSWVEEAYPGISDSIISYIIGHDSLKATRASQSVSFVEPVDVRLRMDGLFNLKEHAMCLVQEFTALYTNGPAAGGGICTGHKREIILHKKLVERESIFWRTEIKKSESKQPSKKDDLHDHPDRMNTTREENEVLLPSNNSITDPMSSAPAQPNKKIPLYKLAHSRAGDKGNDLNFSIIPHLPNDIDKLKQLLTADWVKHVVSSLLDISSFPNSKAIEQRNKQMEQVNVEIYEVPGIHSLNIVVRNILDGGVNCSRRIDRHGKTISDLILCQEVNWPPLTSEDV